MVRYYGVISGDNLIEVSTNKQYAENCANEFPDGWSDGSNYLPYGSGFRVVAGIDSILSEVNTPHTKNRDWLNRQDIIDRA